MASAAMARSKYSIALRVLSSVACSRKKRPLSVKSYVGTDAGAVRSDSAPRVLSVGITEWAMAIATSF